MLSKYCERGLKPHDNKRGGREREEGAFSESPPYAVCETAVVTCARTARLWEENRLL